MFKLCSTSCDEQQPDEGKLWLQPRGEIAVRVRVSFACGWGQLSASVPVPPAWVVSREDDLPGV